MRTELSISEEDYQRIFAFHPEDTEQLFTTDEVTDHHYAMALRDTLIPRIREIRKRTPSAGELDVDDTILLQVRELLRLHSSGIIFRGVPGTGKTWYAKQVAQYLAATLKMFLKHSSTHLTATRTSSRGSAQIQRQQEASRSSQKCSWRLAHEQKLWAARWS